MRGWYEFGQPNIACRLASDSQIAWKLPVGSTGHAVGDKEGAGVRVAVAALVGAKVLENVGRGGDGGAAVGAVVVVAASGTMTEAFGDGVVVALGDDACLTGEAVGS
jgi:hypothetical protein